MSNLLFNIRFGSKHIQLSRDWKLYWFHNRVYDTRGPGFKWFAVYCWFGKHL